MDSQTLTKALAQVGLRDSGLFLLAISVIDVILKVCVLEVVFQRRNLWGSSFGK
jgi:hypothetical protein